MTFPAPPAVVSGRPYLIIDVSGYEPVRLDDFIGETGFMIVIAAETRRIEGAGSRDMHGVRFYEKEQGTGKDLRTWHITVTQDDEFEARTLSNY
ncbi:MAG: hypothetical protein ABJD68_04915 [Nakamurella sp.]